MNRRTINFLIASLFWSIGYPCIAGDYALSLPNGYELVRSNVSTHNIVSRNRLVVIPHDISRFGVNGDWVLGVAVTPTNIRFIKGSKSGHFILNTATDDVWTGLSKDSWVKLIDQLDISPPVLEAVVP